LSINILEATASHELDRTRILNSIADPSACIDKLSEEPPEDHIKYSNVNNALSAQFALAGWCNSILHSWGQEKLARALLADTSRQTVQLSFTGVLLFTNQDLLTLVSHLPIGLRVLRLVTWS
ncbi:unnamed protein product, partial [Symbiodinium natans]